MVSLPVIVIEPVAVADALFVNDRLPLPDVGVKPVIVRLVSEPSSRIVSASVPGSFGSPSPNALGDGATDAAGCR
jgi:hypothetical protein